MWLRLSIDSFLLFSLNAMTSWQRSCHGFLQPSLQLWIQINPFPRLAPTQDCLSCYFIHSWWRKTRDEFISFSMAWAWKWMQHTRLEFELSLSNILSITIIVWRQHRSSIQKTVIIIAKSNSLCFLSSWKKDFMINSLSKISHVCLDTYKKINCDISSSKNLTWSLFLLPEINWPALFFHHK